MFVAAMLDAWPDLTEGAVDAVRAAGLPQSVAVEAVPFGDGVLTGTRFNVWVPDENESDTHHEHTRFAALKSQLEASDLSGGTLHRTLDIFTMSTKAFGDFVQTQLSSPMCFCLRALVPIDGIVNSHLKSP